ncbi:unnamed protein product [Brachionus calyciflorus]|uniref:mRNA-capping enzyme n=1 Tax=Brachionus calyciflorus TaxID=104777 RepID=A0A814F4L5_9BILA|nr:unnamed protein product [Brachionus calyciflorus]
MSKRTFDPLQLPNRWLNCPRKSNTLIAEKFVAFKVPLKTMFNPNVPIECRFTVQMLLDSVKKNFHKKIGMIIDLTNTTRFYDAETEVKSQGIKYVKIQCRGHGETPNRDQTDLFLKVVDQFMNFSVDMAINLFAEARPPGIYKQDYINELFNRYDPGGDIPVAPATPTWDLEGEEEERKPVVKSNSKTSSLSDDEDDFGIFENNQPAKKFRPQNQKRPRREESNVNPVFAVPDLPGVEPCSDLDEISRVRLETQGICNWNGAGFPGAQPVSMDQKNICLLYQKKYRVSWKADGTRYLMYINGRGRIYMLDRDNSVFCVHNLSFPDRQDLDRHLTSTLIDGEFVMDQDPSSNRKIPRFLIYDVVKFENEMMGQQNFDLRMQCIDRELIQPRYKALSSGKINREMEPFSVRKKDFFPLMETKKLISPEFAKKLAHGIDGLIYQPVDDPYKCGRCDSILKWKPPSMNSVDFRLDIVEFQEIGGLPEKIGYLYVNGFDKPFSNMKVTKAMRDLNGKIIECRWWENRWDFMRERTDKSYPNHYNTAMAVCESIKNPITEERLMEIVYDVERRRHMQPPPPHFHGQPYPQAPQGAYHH